MKMIIDILSFPILLHPCIKPGSVPNIVCDVQLYLSEKQRIRN